MALSNKEISNLACIARVIVGPCTSILQDVLKNKITLSDLRKKFNDLFTEEYFYIEFFYNVHLLIYEYGGNYSDFDIPLLYFFLISICNIPVVKSERMCFPSGKDRSLSANIDRIYLMHRKYRYFEDRFLKDSTFEKDWKIIFQTVKELEEYIGSDTANQDTMKKIKNSSMDPDIEHVFITKLGIGRRIYRQEPFYMLEHFKMIPVFKSDIQECASRDIEFFLDHYDLRELAHSKEKAKEKSEKYQQITSEKLKELFSSFKVMFPEVDTDRKSFARDILKDDILKIENAIGSLSENVVLNTKKDIWKAKWPKAEARVVKVEVVYDGVEDQFFVSRKGISSDVLTDIPYDEGDCVKVILISSDSIPVVSAKLIAYKNFKRVINEKEIYLQHEYEDFDNVAKLIAYNIVSSFCLYLDSLIHTFTNDLHKIMVDNYDKPLKTEEIRKMCFNVFERTAKTHKPLGSARALSCRWSFPISLLIGEQISEENLKGADAWDEIQSVCCNTVEDFKIILSTLEDLKTNEFCVDQEKQIEELLKSDIFPEGLLLECPSIIKYIAGYRQEKEVVKVYLSSDDKEAKTFIRTHCKVSKEALLEFIDVENIDKNQEEEEINPAVAESTIAESMQIIRENGEKILAKYSNVIGIRVGQTGPHCITLYCLDRTIVPFGEHPLPKFIEGRPCNVKEAFFILGTCPLNCTDELSKPGCSIGVPEKQGAGSSTGVPATQGAGSSIGIHSKQDAESRIGLLTKQDVGSSNGVPAKQSEGSRNGVPAKQSDGSRNGVPAKQSEGSRIGLPTKQCAGSSTEVPKKQGAGSSIGVFAKQGEGSRNGVPATQGAGSVGIFYESKTGSRYGSGFVTAAHVAIESCYHLRYQDKLLSNCLWKKTEKKPKHEIVHPKCKMIYGKEHIVGDVVESFYGKYKLSPTLFEGLDFAVVKTKHCREGKKEMLQFVERQNLADREVVTKTGKATRKTEGVLSKDVMFAEMSIPGSDKKIYLPELYIVHDKEKGNPFFEKGDSGSGVFVVGKDKKEYVLGIGIAVDVACQRGESYVCKIDQIIKNLELTLVKYTEEGQQQILASTENSF